MRDFLNGFVDTAMTATENYQNESQREPGALDALKDELGALWTNFKASRAEKARLRQCEKDQAEAQAEKEKPFKKLISACEKYTAQLERKKSFYGFLGDLLKTVGLAKLSERYTVLPIDQELNATAYLKKVTTHFYNTVALNKTSGLDRPELKTVKISTTLENKSLGINRLYKQYNKTEFYNRNQYTSRGENLSFEYSKLATQQSKAASSLKELAYTIKATHETLVEKLTALKASLTQEPFSTKAVQDLTKEIKVIVNAANNTFNYSKTLEESLSSYKRDALYEEAVMVDYREIVTSKEAVDILMTTTPQAQGGNDLITQAEDRISLLGKTREAAKTIQKEFKRYYAAKKTSDDQQTKTPPVAKIAVTTTQEKKTPGFFSRLFGGSTKQQPTTTTPAAATSPAVSTLVVSTSVVIYSANDDKLEVQALEGVKTGPTRRTVKK